MEGYRIAGRRRRRRRRGPLALTDTHTHTHSYADLLFSAAVYICRSSPLQFKMLLLLDREGKTKEERGENGVGALLSTKGSKRKSHSFIHW